MPACVSAPEPRTARRNWCATCGLSVALILMSACQDRDAGGQLTVHKVDAQWANGRLSVHCEQEIKLSDEARNALVHGVPLTLELVLILKDSRNQNHVGEDTSRHELRYLPLSEYYQVSRADGSMVTTFPRLRHALAHLAELDRSFETGALPAGDYELMARSRLDKSEMPPPMRLPALFSSAWKHDSNWTSWPLFIDPGG